MTVMTSAILTSSKVEKEYKHDVFLCFFYNESLKST